MSLWMDKISPTEYRVILPTLFYPHILKVTQQFYVSGVGCKSDIAYIEPYDSIVMIDKNSKVEKIELLDTDVKGRKEMVLKTHQPIGMPRHGFSVEVYRRILHQSPEKERCI